MGNRNAWREFFNGHASVYMENVFTKNTAAEVDFLIEELGLTPGSMILDIGCGTGRHSVALAQRGYRMTGVDLSPGMLAEARKTAEAAGVELELVEADATRFQASRKYDAAFCLCEGSFGLLGTGDDAIEHPLTILRNIAAALKPGAKALFTVLSAFRMIRRHSQADVESGQFDPLTLAEASDVTDARERGFVPTELRLLFAIGGLRVLHIWGGTAGSWNKGAIDLDEYEIMIVAEAKP